MNSVVLISKLRKLKCKTIVSADLKYVDRFKNDIEANETKVNILIYLEFPSTLPIKQQHIYLLIIKNVNIEIETFGCPQ